MKIIPAIILLILSMVVSSEGQSTQKELKATVKAEVNYLMFFPRE